MNSTVHNGQNLHENLAHQTRNKGGQFWIHVFVTATHYTIKEEVKCVSLKIKHRELVDRSKNFQRGIGN